MLLLLLDYPAVIVFLCFLLLLSFIVLELAMSYFYFYDINALVITSHFMDGFPLHIGPQAHALAKASENWQMMIQWHMYKEDT